MVDLRKILGDLDLSAVVFPDDKLKECEFFCDLLRAECDLNKFRWLLAAFLNACYGYLEFKATYLHYAYSDPETGDPIEDREALETLKKYVQVFRKKNKAGFIKTAGLSELMKKLYEFRNRSTHDGGIEIMQVGSNLPRDFHIGIYRGKGTPALEFCDEILSFFKELELQLDSW